MSRVVLTLIAILLAVAGALSLVTSGAEYAAEKMYFYTMRTNQKIAVNPDVAPPAMLTQVEQGFRKIIERYPDTVSAKRSYLSLSEFYVGTGKYEQAIAAANEVITKHTDDLVMASQAQFLKGVAFEKQNMWPQALREFLILRDKYSNTFLGLGIPLYIGEYYREQGQDPEAIKVFGEAIGFYERIEDKNKGQPLGYAAGNLLIRTYLLLERYDKAGEVLENIIRDYPTLKVYIQQIPNIEAIFINKLNKIGKALQLYESIKVGTKDDRVIKFLDERIKALTVQKNKQ